MSILYMCRNEKQQCIAFVVDFAAIPQRNECGKKINSYFTFAVGGFVAKIFVAFFMAFHLKWQLIYCGNDNDTELQSIVRCAWGSMRYAHLIPPNSHEFTHTEIIVPE